MFNLKPADQYIFVNWY